MSNKRPLAPSFINTIDQNLLVNKPSVWSSRVHLVAYYILLFVLFVLVLGFAIPSDAREDGSLGAWTTLLGIISGLGLIIWIIYLLRFNVFKRFGKQGRLNGLQTFLLYFLCVGLFVAVPFVPSMIETAKAHQKYSYDEIATDINNINLKLVRLEHDSLDLSWERTTIVYSPLGDKTVESEYSAEGGRITITDDTARFNREIVAADSLKKVNDSTYIIYECPNFVFSNSWQLEDKTGIKLLNSIDIYRQAIENYQPPADRKALENELLQLISKYKVNNSYYSSDYYLNEEAKQIRVSNRRGISQLNDGIGNVVQKMNRWDESNQTDFLMVFYYITLSITLLLFAFRHTTARTFFLTLLAGTLILILTGLLLSASSYGSEIFPLSLILVYYAVFAIVALYIFRSKVRTAVHGIGLNLFLVLTPFIPLIVTGLVYANLRDYYSSKQELETKYQEIMKNQDLYLYWSQVAGFVLLLIMIQPVFKRLYRKWFALGEE